MKTNILPQSAILHIDSPTPRARRLGLWAGLALLPLMQLSLLGADAAAFIQDLIQTKDVIQITLTSMNVNGATGYAHFTKVKQINIPSSTGGPFIAPHLTAVAVEFFNDRFKGEQPFDAGNTDKLELDVRPTEVVLTLRSWGNGKIRFAPSLTENLLYGWSQDGKTYVVLHFTKNTPVL